MCALSGGGGGRGRGRWAKGTGGPREAAAFCQELSGEGNELWPFCPLQPASPTPRSSLGSVTPGPPRSPRTSWEHLLLPARLSLPLEHLAPRGSWWELVGFLKRRVGGEGVRAHDVCVCVCVCVNLHDPVDAPLRNPRCSPSPALQAVLPSEFQQSRG